MCKAIEDAILVLQQQDIANMDGKYCANGGSCVYNYEISEAKCVCAEGFTGSRCQERLDAVCSRNPCKYGTCSVSKNSTGDYECACSPGWTGKNCNERLECSIQTECAANNTASVKFSYIDNKYLRAVSVCCCV